MPRNRWASTPSARPRSWPDAHGAFALAIAAAAAFAATPVRADFSGKVVAVADGDTLTVRDGTRDVHVRLWGIDAPERGQPWSKRSRESLVALALRRDARVVERGRDSYGRTLAQVRIGDVDLAEAQVRGGWAWVFLRYTNDAALVALEADARAARRGLWSSPDPEPPWRYRERTHGTAKSRRLRTRSRRRSSVGPRLRRGGRVAAATLPPPVLGMYHAPGTGSPPVARGRVLL